MSEYVDYHVFQLEKTPAVRIVVELPDGTQEEAEALLQDALGGSSNPWVYLRAGTGDPFAATNPEA